MDLQAAVLTASDRCSRGAPDLSGALLVRQLSELGFQLAEHAVVPDDKLAIVKKLVHWSDDLNVNLIVTTGGTGASPRDVTPEATRMAIDRPFPGLCEAMRAESTKHTPFGLLSRSEAGSRGRTLILNFPGNPKAIEELWPVVAPVLVHACRLLAGQDDPHTH